MISVMWSNSLRREKLPLKDELNLLEDAKVHIRNPCAKANKFKKKLCGLDIVYMKGKIHILAMAV